jgi:hypothetical protein
LRRLLTLLCSARQVPARQVEVFARSVLRNAEATSASLNKAEDKARAGGTASQTLLPA